MMTAVWFLNLVIFVTSDEHSNSFTSLATSGPDTIHLTGHLTDMAGDAACSSNKGSNDEIARFDSQVPFS